MTAELCDNFKSKDGVIEISKLCKKLNFNYSFYTNKKEFLKKYKKRLQFNLNELAFNWKIFFKKI